MTAGDFAITMIIGYFAATVVSLIGALVVGVIFMTFVDQRTGIIAGTITAVVLFIVIGIATFKAARKDK